MYYLHMFRQEIKTNKQFQSYFSISKVTVLDEL